MNYFTSFGKGLVNGITNSAASVASTLGLVGSPTSASTRDEEKEEEDEDGEEEQEQRVKVRWNIY